MDIARCMDGEALQFKPESQTAYYNFSHVLIKLPMDKGRDVLQSEHNLLHSTLNTLKMFDLVGFTVERNKKSKTTKNGRNFKGYEMKLQDRDAQVHCTLYEVNERRILNQLWKVEIWGEIYGREGLIANQCTSHPSNTKREPLIWLLPIRIKWLWID